MNPNQVRIPTVLGLYVSVTNIADTGFTISWITNVPTTGTVSFGSNPDALTQSAIDDRDQESLKATPHKTHHVTIGKTMPLSPDTNYYFAIRSGNTSYDDHGKPYQIKTAPEVGEQMPQADSISGSIVTSGNVPAAGSIVYFVLPNVSPQSTLTTSSGNWIIPLSLARSADLSQFAVYDQQGSLGQIYVQADNGESSSAVVVLASARPVPVVVLGKNYDWRNNQTPSPTPAASISATLGAKTGFPLFSPTLSPTLDIFNPTIFYPKPNERITIPRPSFLGRGASGTTLNLAVDIAQKISGSVKVAPDGTWEWSVPVDLSPGRHTLSVSYNDPKGSVQKIIRSFSIIEGKVQGVADVAFAASPSGSLKPTPTSIPTPTTSPLASATPRPTASSRLTTPTPSIPPTLITPTPTLPVSGESLPATILVGIGLMMLLGGIFVPVLLRNFILRNDTWQR
ncbi:MAG: Large repetitive protein [Microgenomates group bacterium GW2011_GWA2_44_7]|nr:MAG: Large repetitive protein [Microgenomates group bacterium GW2011_GWA2_44_7]